MAKNKSVVVTFRVDAARELARSEAIKRNAQVTLCASSNGSTPFLPASAQQSDPPAQLVAGDYGCAAQPAV